MKIKLGEYEENPAWYGTLGDYDNPERYELKWKEVDVTMDELVKLINDGRRIRVNC